MQILCLEINMQRYSIHVEEIERLLPLTGEFACESGIPERVVLSNVVYRVVDLREVLCGSPSHFYLGTRLVIPRNKKDLIFLAELITDLVEVQKIHNSIDLVNGKDFKRISLKTLVEECER